MSRKSHNAKGAFGRKRPHVSTGADGLVYHFTDTARLPWILESGELQVDRGAIGKYPTKFVWATTLHNGDRTCSSLGSDQTCFKLGWHRYVRFTFQSHEFEPWTNIRNHPDWTPELFHQLDSLGKSKGGIHNEVGAVGYVLGPPYPASELPSTLSRDVEAISLGVNE